jgi:single-strand DNA-binding protein
MAKDLNKVQIIGRLGGDPEMRYLASGAAVTNFSVASGRSWKDRDGAAHEETEWFRVVAWEKLGEICNQYLTKGMRVYIEGRLQTRKYTDRDGIERYATEVVAQDMIMLSPKGSSAPAEDFLDDEQPEQPAPPPPSPSSAPAAPARRAASSPRTSAPNAPRVSRNQPRPIESDDDIPF